MSRPSRAAPAPAEDGADQGDGISIRTPPTRVVALVTVAATVVTVVLGAVTGTAVLLIGLLVFLPAFASALCTPRQTTLVSAWVSIVVIVPVALSTEQLADRVTLALFALGFGALAVYGSWLRITREERWCVCGRPPPPCSGRSCARCRCSPTTCSWTACTSRCSRTSSSGATSTTWRPPPGAPGY